MDSKILKEELDRISQIMGVKSKILNEQPFPTLEKELGHDVADAVEIGFGKRLAQDIDFTLSNKLSSSLNLITRGASKFLKSNSGAEVPMSTLKQIIKDVADGTLFGKALDDELDKLPRRLADGSDFREPLGNKLRMKSAQVNQGAGSQGTGAAHGGGNAPHTGPGGGNAPHTGSGGGNDPLANIQPEEPSFVGHTEQETEKIISRLRQNPRFVLYEQKVKNLPISLTEKERNLLLTGFEQYGRKDVSELVAEIQRLRSQTYGPLKKILTTVLQKPLKSAAWTSSAILAILLVKWTLKAYKATDKGVQGIVNYFSGDDSSTSGTQDNTTPTNNDNSTFDPRKP